MGEMNKINYLKALEYHQKGKPGKIAIVTTKPLTHNRNRLWQGECFVFDDRRAVASDLSPAEGHWLERGDQ